MSDEEDRLIVSLLSGMIPQKSERGRQAQEALASQLGALAYGGKLPSGEVLRALQSAFRHPTRIRIAAWSGRERAHLRTFEIAVYVCLYRLRHGNRGVAEASFKAAAELFDVTRSKVASAWAQYKDTIDLTFGSTEDQQVKFAREM